MSAASNYLENKVLNHVLRYTSSAYVPPASNAIYLALFTGTASDVLVALESGTNATTVGNWGRYEVNNGSYSRTAITFGTDATTGSISNTVNCTFPTATANYDNTNTDGSTVTCIALVDASTAGNILFYGLLTNSKEILNGDTFQVATGNLTISLA